MRLLAALPLSLVALLSGCALTSTATSIAEPGLAIQGVMHGGQQPIAGAHVYLFAAGTNGYGGPGIAPYYTSATNNNASVSLLDPTVTGLSDSVGAYVLTTASGNFTIPTYTCTPGTQVYLYGLGGNPGAGANSAAGLLAALGNCPAAGNFATSVPYISVNEISTVAAAYAFAGFASDATHVSSSGTALAQTGIANALANATNLASIASGQALATTPSGVGTAPQATVNTLANILATCVNTADTATSASSTCKSLFALTRFAGTSGATPTDTASAAINIAHNAAANVSSLYPMPPLTSPYGSSLTAQPNDFSLSINWAPSVGQVIGVTIDAAGNAWIPTTSGIMELSSSWQMLSGTAGHISDSFVTGKVAIDQSGNVWFSVAAPTNVYPQTTYLMKLSPSGTVLSGATGYPGLGLSSQLQSITLDGAGNVWLLDVGNRNVVKVSNAGALLSGPNGYVKGQSPGTGIGQIATDGSGNLWAVDGNLRSIVEISSTGAFLSPSTGFAAIPADNITGLAIDGSGNAWVGAETAPGDLYEFSNSGAALSGANGFGVVTQNQIFNVAIDGGGNVWVPERLGIQMSTPPYGLKLISSVAAYSPSGAALTGAAGYAIPVGVLTATGVAIDGSGNVWGAGPTYVSEVIGAAIPVITPIAAGLPVKPTTDGSSNLGTRP